MWINTRRIFLSSCLAVIPLSFSSAAQADNNTVLSGVLDLPRQAETDAIDGCQKAQRGLTLDGGFLLIACEKLRPGLPIQAQDKAADLYVQDILDRGWAVDVSNQEPDKMTFTRSDDMECETKLSMMVWTDRSLNEPRRPDMTRDDFRQIVFITEFEGGGQCEHHYETVTKIADNR